VTERSAGARNGPTEPREVELFDPIRDALERRGWIVRAEVEHCDIVAYDQGRLIVIELKRRFGVEVLLQAVARQRITADVYLGLPRAALRSAAQRRRAGRLLRRLELGLILVDLDRSPAAVDIVIEPKPYRKRISSRLRTRVLEEMIGRSGGQNRGGTSATKLMTAYRENALQIACCLAQRGAMAPRELRTLGCGPKTSSILQRNVYGWFRRVSLGIYDLTSSGWRAIEEHASVAGPYLEALSEAGRAGGAAEEGRPNAAGVHDVGGSG
jgi:hypothetical protein